MKTIGSVLILLVCFGAKAQSNSNHSAQEVLDKVVTYYKDHPQLEYDLTYSLYRDFKNPKIIEQYKGVLSKDRKNSYLKIKDTEFITVQEDFLKINHSQKRMQFVKNAQGLQVSNPLNIDAYLKYFSTREVFEENGALVCKLSTPKFTQLPYGTIWMFVNPQTFELEKQIMELTAPKSIKDENGVFTTALKYLEIELTSSQNEIDFISKINIGAYITLKNKKYQPVALYSDYQMAN